MIVKNEAANLGECLSKVASFVDEIIIVDTGSTDDTKGIAAYFTDKIFEFTWCDDFAAARNFSLSQAHNDWVLVLDADEYVERFSRQDVLKLVNKKSRQHTVGRIQRINVLDDTVGSRKVFERINRLFNRNLFCYKGIIHEQVVLKDGSHYAIELVDIAVEHIGYTSEILARSGKVARNIGLLEKALVDHPNDPYLYYQIGKSYYLLKRYDLAQASFTRALGFPLDFRLEYVSELIETYGYALINDGKYTEAMILEEYATYFEDSPDFFFIMGLIYMNNALFTSAVEYFLSCTRFSCGKAEGITTYLPYHNVGVIYEVLGHRELALQHYQLCGEYEPARQRCHALKERG